MLEVAWEKLHGSFYMYTWALKTLIKWQSSKHTLISHGNHQCYERMHSGIPAKIFISISTVEKYFMLLKIMWFINLGWYTCIAVKNHTVCATMYHEQHMAIHPFGHRSLCSHTTVIQHHPGFISIADIPKNIPANLNTPTLYWQHHYYNSLQKLEHPNSLLATSLL